jgi:ornithine decarboxylase
MLKRDTYISNEDWKKLKTFSEDLETPFLVVNLSIIKKKYEELTHNFPYAKIHYAVKANPAVEVIDLLHKMGSNFDVASVYELRKLLNLGVSADKISFGNTIKKAKDIREHYEAGVRLYVTDSEPDLRNIAKAAPGSKVFVRILVEGLETADWPLSRKFGCQTDMAGDLIILAKKLGLIPYGVSFHVGSQQRDIASWDGAISKVKYLFSWLEEEGIKLQMINMGGGFPASYTSRTNELTTYAEEITRYLQEDFGEELPEIILEPGRSLVGDAGVLVSEVVLISRKSRHALNRWIYTDVGKFSGLIETLEESIKYPIFCERKSETEECVIAGPTCDSQDIMYEDFKYELPLTLAIGDRLYFMSTGAYTSSYSSVEFNGFPPLKTYFIE